MKITAKLIKLILMYKYRYKDGLMVTSECCGHGHGIADIITYDLKKEIMVEIEIKISKQDLKKDIKKFKHEWYKDKDNINIQKFYYAVPTFMIEYTKAFLKEHELPYGIIEIIEDKVDGFEFKYFGDFETLMRVEKRCTKFNNNKPLARQVNSFMKRISSELVSREQELFLLKKELEEENKE